MPTLSNPELAEALEGANSLILRWGHNQMRQLKAEEVERIVAALKASASSERLPAGCRIAEAYRVIPEGNWYVVQIDGPTTERRLENFLRDEGYKFLVRRAERERQA